jgi:uncharacterized membrane protein YbhN (UPF0104 family)
VGSGREKLVNVVRAALATLVLVAVVVALARNWHAVSGELRRIDAGSLVLAFALALLSPVLTLLGWRVLLADLGTRLALPASASVFYVGQLGKYLPGSVWSVVAQAEMGSRLGVPRRRMGVVGLLAIGLAMVTGALVGVPAVPLLVARAGAHLSPGWVVAAVVAGTVLLWPRLLNALIGLGLRLLRREPLEHDLSAAAIALTTLWFVLAWAAAGLSVLVLARAVARDADLGHLALAAICGFALAAAVGMLSVIVPAGVGVRDGVLALLLVTLMPLPAATAVVVISRFLTVLVDVVVAGLGWAWGRAHHLLGSRA